MPRAPRRNNGFTDSPPSSSQRGNGAPNGVTDEEVARRAYEIYQNRGGRHGADLDDWLEAERQLRPGPSDVTGPINLKPRKRKSREGAGA
jgi:DUF2934 family protein